MGNEAIEKELVNLEKQYWQAIRDRDFNAALRLTDDPCIVAGSQGLYDIDHKSFAKMMEADSSWTLQSFELNDVHARLISDDVAIVAYKIREEVTVEGEPLTMEATDSSTWVRRDGRWLCALHTEAITGDPFGRDKQPGNGA